jgi:hypothetical protein
VLLIRQVQQRAKALGFFEWMNVFPLKVFDALNFETLRRPSFPGRGPARPEVRRYARHGTGVIRQQFQTAPLRLPALAAVQALCERGSFEQAPGWPAGIVCGDSSVI